MPPYCTVFADIFPDGLNEISERASQRSGTRHVTSCHIVSTCPRPPIRATDQMCEMLGLRAFDGGVRHRAEGSSGTGRPRDREVRQPELGVRKDGVGCCLPAIAVASARKRRWCWRTLHQPMGVPKRNPTEEIGPAHACLEEIKWLGKHFREHT